MSRREPIVFEPPIDGGIVVGHDGSEQGDRALEWAVEDAHRRGGAAVHLVRAWQLANVMGQIDGERGVVPSYQQCEDGVRRGNLEAIARALRTVPEGSVPVHEHTLHAPGAEVLIEASKGADLLVVGDRGRGGFTGMLLGSTAGHVLRYADCPVVVVRGRAPHGG